MSIPPAAAQTSRARTLLKERTLKEARSKLGIMALGGNINYTGASSSLPGEHQLLHGEVLAAARGEERSWGLIDEAEALVHKNEQSGKTMEGKTSGKHNDKQQLANEPT